MEKEARLQAIYDMISKSEVPVSGSALSKKFNVSRQVIVQDIALLKARNVHIYATHKGYVCSHQRVRRVFSCFHLNDRMEEEMNAIVDCGGCIENVFVKHNVYGKLEAKMNISSRKQVRGIYRFYFTESGKTLNGSNKWISLSYGECTIKRRFRFN